MIFKENNREIEQCAPQNKAWPYVYSTRVPLQMRRGKTTPPPPPKKKKKYPFVISIVDPPWEDQCEWHRITRMTGPDIAVMCNSINTHTNTYTGRLQKETDGQGSLLYASTCLNTTAVSVRLVPVRVPLACLLAASLRRLYTSRSGINFPRLSASLFS